MERIVLYSSEYIRIFRNDEGYFIESFKQGMSFDELNKVISDNPEIKIISFNVLRTALINAPMGPQKFGEKKERISVEFSNDKLKAYITLCVDNEELENPDGMLADEILKKLQKSGVLFGIKEEILKESFVNGHKLLIAEGIPPQNGEDSVITMYQPKEARPRLTSLGKVNYYDVELINVIHAGDWVGERREALPGIPGMSVMGTSIEPIHGKTFPLFYDKGSICEVYEKGITTLYALKDGGVLFKEDKLTVSDHLKIDGDVDFKTGNIDFKGFVTIQGTIEDAFSVCADRDIEVRSEYGMGAVQKLESRTGNIYIRGGLAGKNKAIVKANNDVYIKYVSDATVICGGAVHIGYYCLNSNIVAKEVILDSIESYIIGGHINAEVKVSASTFGSESETRTCISVEGFNREELKQKLESIIYEIEAQRSELIKIRFGMEHYPTKKMSRDEYEEFEAKSKQYEVIKKKILQMETDKKNIAKYMNALGDGEVTVRVRAYPNTSIMIKGINKVIKKPLPATNLYYMAGVIKQKQTDWRG